MTPREELLAAADVIRTRGWCRGVRIGPGGRCCMLGALSLAITGDPQFFDVTRTTAYNALLLVVRGEDCGGVIDFNDDHCKSKRDAIAALEIAADLAA